jgi:hypothetical protein
MKYPNVSEYYKGNYHTVENLKFKDYVIETNFYASNPLIQEAFTTGVTYFKDENGELIPKKFKDDIDPYTGYYLYELIKLNKFKRCIINYMRNGMAALYICQAFLELEQEGEKGNFELICIDDRQNLNQEWKGTGVTNMSLAGFDKYYRLINEPSHIALPKLLQGIINGTEQGFDLIFLNGHLLFDYAFNDIFNADFLLNIGGCIGIADIRFPSIKEVSIFIDKNYKHFKNLKFVNPSRTISWYEKIGPDTREWYEHNSICK